MNRQTPSSANRGGPPADAPLQYVKGIGPKRASALEAVGIRTIRDLLFYFPFDYLDRSKIISIRDLRKYVDAERPVTVIGEVYRVEMRRSRRSNRLIFFLTLKDDTGFLTCVWFEGVQWFKDAFELGELLAVSAYPDFDKLGRIQFTHPEFDRLRGAQEEDEPDWGKLFNTGAIIPKYPSTSELGKVGLDSRGFRRIIRNALKSHLMGIEEVLPEEIRERANLAGCRTALQGIHFPENSDALEIARRRLKFEELFFLQLMLAYRKRRYGLEKKGITYSLESTLARKLVAALPFQLTKAQRRVLREIADDMRKPTPMNRLLQGDVGSGKTIVALLSMLVAVENDFQVALMAPTEVLAEQHYRTLCAYLENLPVNVRLLIGGQKKKLREDVLEDLRSGRAQIVVGTHALLEENVRFAHLGFVVIDEQHRFGVMQRATLREKGLNPDVLVMTATPIPRTLALTVYGDLDVSVIDEMPANRKPIKTGVRLEDQKDKVYDFVKQEVRQGRQVYIVFPLIEESEKVDLKAATVEFEHLKSAVFPSVRLGLLHGRMKSEEKDQIMQSFKAGEIQILVSTTVIEVGIDVPNATIMIVENAERFGLSQLHQLRGRVGRGADQSFCILIANYGWFDGHRRGLEPGEVKKEKLNAKIRLETMVETIDGFKIAEVDLRLRGPGEFFGLRQSGVPAFRLANLVEDAELVAMARKEAFSLVDRDPQLRSDSHRSVRKHFESQYRDALELGNVG
ncbi:MAG: ATP-dependent DNA helicase RecG [Ignavibacteria bacterium GWA2_54_16]|nr:MAG: ATP-dependent DNA helicase RecG [Ignavibacteria bacterium GWA2_54_16]